MALIANFKFRMPAGGIFDPGVLYQLDDGPPTLSSLGVSRSPVTFLSLRFGQVKIGRHRLSVSLIDMNGRAVGYEQRCFTISSTKPTAYDITRLPDRQRETDLKPR
jgi:hypothetical protein